MLADELKQLLTAYVDGELSQRQRRAVARLLHRSPEARTLLAHLYDDAKKIRTLPRHKVEPSLAPVVLQTITEQGLQINRPAAPVVRRRWRPYAAAMLAASVLLGATGGVLFLVSDSQEAPQPNVNTSVAANNPTPAPAPVPKRAPERETPPPRKPPNPLIRDLIDVVVRDFTAPIPAEREPVFSVAFRELQGDLGAEKLASRLDKDHSIQLDITVKNNDQALRRLQAVLQENGIKVVFDPHASKSLKKDAAKTEYLVYAENLRSDEMTKILRELGRDDSTQKTFQKSPYEQVTLTPLTAKEKKQVSSLLGVEPAKIEIAAEKKDNTTAPKFNRWERSALILPPSQPARPSQEVQSFVRQRQPRPGTLQVLVRIRQEK